MSQSQSDNLPAACSQVNPATDSLIPKVANPPTPQGKLTNDQRKQVIRAMMEEDDPVDVDEGVPKQVREVNGDHPDEILRTVDGDDDVPGGGRGKGKETRKTNTKGNGKRNGKGNGKGKGKSKGTRKGKEKEKAVEDLSETVTDGVDEFGMSDSEKETDEVKKKKSTKKNTAAKKKVIYAKVPVWKDIPDWGERTDCPVLSLPSEILNMCFGLQESLELSDYVALAGSCKFFRHHYTDEFWHELIDVKGLIEYRPSFDLYTGRHEPFPDMFKPGRNHVNAPFSRQVDDWWKAPPTVIPASHGSYFTPPGVRSTWSKDDYERYRSEKDAWVENERRIQKTMADLAAVEAETKRKQGMGWVEVNGRDRRVSGIIKGRKDGEPAVEKNERGIPLKNNSQGEAPSKAMGKSTGSPIDQDQKTTADQPIATGSKRPAVTADDDEKETNALLPPEKKRRTSSTTVAKAKTAKGRKAKKSKKGRNAKESKWVVPDTDDEGELARPVRYDCQGNVIPHDHWKSRYRDDAVRKVNRIRITKTDAIKSYNVSEAELISLTHVLATNPIVSKQRPQQLFIKTAVESLAYRAHGGYLGHIAHLKKGEERARKALETRKANGTYRPPKPKSMPPWRNPDGSMDGYDDDEMMDLMWDSDLDMY